MLVAAGALGSGGAIAPALGIALVPEGRQLFPSLTVEENLVIGARTGRPGSATIRARVLCLRRVQRTSAS